MIIANTHAHAKADASWEITDSTYINGLVEPKVVVPQMEKSGFGGLVLVDHATANNYRHVLKEMIEFYSSEPRIVPAVEINFKMMIPARLINEVKEEYGDFLDIKNKISFHVVYTEGKFNKRHDERLIWFPHADFRGGLLYEFERRGISIRKLFSDKSFLSTLEDVFRPKIFKNTGLVFDVNYHLSSICKIQSDFAFLNPAVLFGSDSHPDEYTGRYADSFCDNATIFPGKQFNFNVLMRSIQDKSMEYMQRDKYVKYVSKSKNGRIKKILVQDYKTISDVLKSSKSVVKMPISNFEYFEEDPEVDYPMDLLEKSEEKERCISPQMDLKSAKELNIKIPAIDSDLALEEDPEADYQMNLRGKIKEKIKD